MRAVNCMKRHHFVAVELPGEVKTKLAGYCSNIQKEHNFKTWVHPEDFHITLAFLGTASGEQINKLSTILTEVVPKHPSFLLNVDHFGFFGNKQHPRIFWTGVEEQPSLYRLQNEVANACNQAGFTLEKRPYAPHITLARKHIESESLSINHEDWWKQYGQEVQFKADHIVIYETHLERVPKYQTIESFSLRN